MRAMLLRQPRPAANSPLDCVDLPTPEPEPDEIRIRVRACGVCRTDLHIVEGEIQSVLPVVPGHQAVGLIEKLGSQVRDWRVGDRVGVPWLRWTCGQCEYCVSNRENLCTKAQFNGFHAHGGYAEATLAKAAYVVPVPASYGDAEIAPLLCAGIIGLRSLRLSGAKEGQRLGMYGFGASGHITIQIARTMGCDVWVATRGAEHQQLAKQLGAAWVGRAEDVPASSLHAAILFAPAGRLVPIALRALAKGGTLALAGITMSPIPELAYDSLYHERIVRSVANATREDAQALMKQAAAVSIRAEVTTFPLEEANRALLAMKQSRIRGAAVLQNAGAHG